MSGRATLAFIGDVMLGRLVCREIARRPPESFWGTALPVLRAADAVFANLECAVSRSTREWRRTPKVFRFGAPPEAIEVLKAAQISCVSLANNHVLDFETEGLIDTLDHLDEAGIAHAGAGRSLAEAQAPAVVEAAGLRISFTALTDNEPPFAATEERPGTFYADIEARRDWPQLLADAAPPEEADLAVLSAHLGPNMLETPSHLFRDFADAAVAHGFDIYFGHSAHLFQGVRGRAGAVILHDTGDFLDDYAVDPDLRNDWSFIFLVELEDGRPRWLRMLPVALEISRVDLAEAETADAICRMMIRRCRPFGTELERTDEGLRLKLDQATTSLSDQSS